jgi:hypothetical protein
MPKLENKESILKVVREKCQLTYKGKHLRITSDLSAQILKARKAWGNVIQALKWFMSTKPALQGILKGKFSQKRTDNHKDERSGKNKLI